MSEIFYDARSIDYPIIDSDAHVNEPADLWQERVPKKWRERAPRVHHSDRGDIWLFDGGKEKWPMGLTATAGLSYFQFAPVGARYESMRKGSFDTGARLKEMDADGDQETPCGHLSGDSGPGCRLHRHSGLRRCVPRVAVSVSRTDDAAVCPVGRVW